METEKIDNWKQGEPLWTRRLNQLVRSARRNIVGCDPINVSTTESTVYISHRPHDWDWFPAEIQVTSSDFSDQRYRVRRVKPTNSDTAASDLLSWGDYWITPSDFEAVAENLAEDGSHGLVPGKPVIVFRRMDQAGPPAQWRHFFVQSPGEVFAINLLQTAGSDGSATLPATWKYLITQGDREVQSDVDPAVSPHKWTRPAVGMVTPASYGYATWSDQHVIVGWINEVPLQAACSDA